MVVAGHIVVPAVPLVDRIRQADAGYDAVAQGNVGILVLGCFRSFRLGLHQGGVWLGSPGRDHRQHQQSQGQQQADKAFFHNAPPF